MIINALNKENIYQKKLATTYRIYRRDHILCTQVGR